MYQFKEWFDISVTSVDQLKYILLSVGLYAQSLQLAIYGKSTPACQCLWYILWTMFTVSHLRNSLYTKVTAIIITCTYFVAYLVNKGQF